PVSDRAACGLPDAGTPRRALLELQSLDALHGAIRQPRRTGHALPPALAGGLRGPPPAGVPLLRHVTCHQARRHSGGTPLSRVDVAAFAASGEADSLDGVGSGCPVDRNDPGVRVTTVYLVGRRRLRPVHGGSGDPTPREPGARFGGRLAPRSSGQPVP